MSNVYERATRHLTELRIIGEFHHIVHALDETNNMKSWLVNVPRLMQSKTFVGAALLARHIDSRVFDPMPDTTAKISRIDSCEKLYTFDGVNFCTLCLVTLHAK